MIVEWELTMKCNYNCEYCGLLDNNIKEENDKNKLKTFIEQLNINYPNEEVFLFGGEPFLNKNIKYIIKQFKILNQKFIIQTNFSKQSVDILNTIDDMININISIHPFEVDINLFIQYYKQINSNIIINEISLMFIDATTLRIYNKLYENGIKCTLTPISNFKVQGFENSLIQFNKLKNQFKNKYNFEEGNRSYIWEDQLNGIGTFKYQECKYKNNYILYDCNLQKYTCSYRENNNICPHDLCFIM